MPDHLNGPPAELRMTIDITRAETGQTETIELVGHVTAESEPEEDIDD